MNTGKKRQQEKMLLSRSWAIKVRREIRQCLDEIANQRRISLRRSQREHV